MGPMTHNSEIFATISYPLVINIAKRKFKIGKDSTKIGITFAESRKIGIEYSLRKNIHSFIHSFIHLFSNCAVYNFFVVWGHKHESLFRKIK